MQHDSSHANGGGQLAVAFAQNTRDEVRLQGGDGQIAGALAAGVVPDTMSMLNLIVAGTLAAAGSSAVNEYIERNTANLAWIDAAFARAREMNAKGIVFAFQADLRFEFEPPLTDQRSGYNDVLDGVSFTAKPGQTVAILGARQHRQAAR